MNPVGVPIHPVKVEVKLTGDVLLLRAVSVGGEDEGVGILLLLVVGNRGKAEVEALVAVVANTESA